MLTGQIEKASRYRDAKFSFLFSLVFYECMMPRTCAYKGMWIYLSRRSGSVIIP